MNVFKMAITGLIVLCFFSSLSAQETIPEKSKKMKYGIGMALNYSEYIAKNDIQNPVDIYEPLPGFSLISSAQLHHNHRLYTSLRPEISFLGSNVKDVDVTFTHLQVAIPITLHARVIDGFHVQSGIGLQYLAVIGAESKSIFVKPIDDEVRNKFSGNLRVGFNYEIADWVDIGLTYNHQLGSLIDLEITDLEGNDLGLEKTSYRNIQFAVIIRQ